MPRFLMKISYDGNGFWGWQIQRHGRSVQHVLQSALHEISGNPSLVIASGRTDTGVHALAQCAHFDYEGSMTPQQMVLAFRTRLPDDVRVMDIIAVPDNFSARYQACRRTYLYKLARNKSPFNRLYMGFVPYKKIDPVLIREAAQLFLGRHDFSSFGRPNPAVPNRICEVQSISFDEFPDHWELIISADRFLHNMVRRIMGALISISHGSLSPRVVTELIDQARPTQNNVFTAPAQGLYLVRVDYPEHFGLTDFCSPDAVTLSTL